MSADDARSLRQLLALCIRPAECELPAGDAEWNALLPLALAHGVGPLLFANLRERVLPVQARDQLRQEYNVETDYLRLRAYPFTREVHDFVKQHDRVYVVEQNRDAQMLTLLKMDLEAALHTRLRSIAHIHGLPLDARSVTDELMTMEGK